MTYTMGMSHSAKKNFFLFFLFFERWAWYFDHGAGKDTCPQHFRGGRFFQFLSWMRRYYIHVHTSLERSGGEFEGNFFFFSSFFPPHPE
ncbi:hypothetical protein F4809DRAFT_212671 [Biscogniauxia mediterranea]|nr:hypothetical protein F4809DRAFT_212671 [Biscogniauxia mediterranea]